MGVEFATIASGSSGNSIYIGTDSTKILIDAGLSGKKIQDGLSDIGVCGNDIDGIFVTHEHIDHVQGIGVLSRRFDIPVYATAGTWKAMPACIGELKEKNKRFVYSDEACVINDICIRPYDIPHDAAEPVGYSIFAEKFKISAATDIGHVTECVMENIKDSDLLLLESNHDVDMLKNGDYPYHLKKRILGNNGHLSNETAGKLLAWAVSESKSLQHVFLGHLSKENNTPAAAYNTVRAVLDEYDIRTGDFLNIYVAARYGVERTIKLA